MSAYWAGLRLFGLAGGIDTTRSKSVLSGAPFHLSAKTAPASAGACSTPARFVPWHDAQCSIYKA